MSLGHVLTVVGLSVLPVSELRGAIPVAVAFGLPASFAYLVTVSCNFLVLPVVLTLLWKLLPYLERVSWIRTLWTAWVRRIERHSRRVSRWGPWALFVLVAVPLPGTGVWTAAAAAFLFEIPLQLAILPTLAGLLVAGAVMLAAALGALNFFV